MEADAEDSFVIINFNQELDPVCPFDTSVTITQDGSPIDITSVTVVGDSDPWGYKYNVDWTFGFGVVIVWTHLASGGDICAVSGAILGDTVETVTTIPA
jgi:hypothetical protein